MHGVCIPHRNSKGQTKIRIRYQSNSKRVVRNLEERNVGTEGGKSAKQDLTSDNDLTIELPKGRESPYHID